ncbi:MAG: hypothetical protein WBV78_04365, partial [Roseobacter sp.]
ALIHRANRFCPYSAEVSQASFSSRVHREDCNFGKKARHTDVADRLTRLAWLGTRVEMTTPRLCTAKLFCAF